MTEVDAKTGKKIPAVDNVRRWALGKPPENKNQPVFDFIDDDDSYDFEAPVCSSVYGLCE